MCFSERQAATGRDPLVVAAVEELKRTDFYVEGGSRSSRVHSKKFEPTALCATVVLSWPDRSRHDEEDERDHDEGVKGPLVLLSAGKEAGLVRFDRYDERSLIENRVNRDGKQCFALGTALARNEAAMWSATIFEHGRLNVLPSTGHRGGARRPGDRSTQQSPHASYATGDSVRCSCADGSSW